MTWPAGVAREVLATVDSTSQEAARRAATLQGPTWICALNQTAAKGRRGRAWVNPAGNFAASLVYRPGGDMADLALRSFVAALALHDAFVHATGRSDPFALKWPNDVLLNGGKVAGILLESGPADSLIIGIGVNLAVAPASADVEPGAVPPAALSDTGTLIPPEDFLDLLAPAYAHYEAQFTTQGFVPIRTAWLARAAKLGAPITARTMRDAHQGTFEDVDAEGNLVLRTAQGRLAITAGDVFF